MPWLPVDEISIEALPQNHPSKNIKECKKNAGQRQFEFKKSVRTSSIDYNKTFDNVQLVNRDNSTI